MRNMLSINLDVNDRATRGFVQMQIPGHGLFTGYADTVTNVASQTPKRVLVEQVHGLWPDLFTKTWLRKQSPFTLALILNQE